jgi:hypothetical protein
VLEGVAQARPRLLEVLLGLEALHVLADLAGHRHEQVAQVAVDRACSRG